MHIKKIVVGVMSCMLVIGGAMTPEDAAAAHKKSNKPAASRSAPAKLSSKPASKVTARGVSTTGAGKVAKGGKATKLARGSKVDDQAARFDRHAPTRLSRTTQPHLRTVSLSPDEQLDMAEAGPAYDERGPLLRSSAVLVQDLATGESLFEKNANTVVPIASITKLMTAMVVLDARLPMNEGVMVSEEDLDIVKGTRSRLSVGTVMSRETALLLALMSSENRAASALSRHYPGGYRAFIQAMNRKARSLGLAATHFEDPTGLTSANHASPRDLVKLVEAANQYPLIRQFSTTVSHDVDIDGRILTFRNTNALVANPEWDISVSKTGFISEAGRCLVMHAHIQGKPLAIVLMDSMGRYTRVADANRVKKWVEHVTGGTRTAVQPDA